MAPQKRSPSPTKPKTKGKAEKEKKEDRLRLDQANFGTQMAKIQKEGNMTEDQLKVWTSYKSFGRFDKA